MKSTRTKILALAGLLSVVIITSCSSDWRQFRGDNFNVVEDNMKLPVEWDTLKNISWTYDFEGVSWSSPIITGNKVIISTTVIEKNISGLGRGTFSSEPPPENENPEGPPPQDEIPQTEPPQQDTPAEEPEEDNTYLEDQFRWELTCIDLKSGEELWKQVVREGSPRVKTHAGNTFASETPVTDGKRIYAYFGMTGVYCYDMEGNLLWEKDLGAFYTENGWGTGSSPVLYEDKLFVQVDNEENSFIIALDASSGEEIWKESRDEKTNYSTPVIWENAERTELVTLGKFARAYDPDNGDLLWSLDLGAPSSIPSAVGNKEVIIMGNTGGPGGKTSLFAVKAGADGNVTPAEGELSSEGVKWVVPEAGIGNPSPIIYDGLLYLVESNGGRINCYDVESGDAIYKERISRVAACWASPWACNGKISFIDDRGVTRTFSAGSSLEVLYENRLDDQFWASPAITKGTYVFKGADKLYCIRN